LPVIFLRIHAAGFTSFEAGEIRGRDPLSIANF
jgi:hypothetical protein